jgi:hypothetical protein
MRARVAVALAMSLLPALARAQDRSVTIPRVSTPPTLEQFLNGTPREAEATITDFVQREPGDGVPASQKTAAHLSYDAENFYIVFVCEDREPEKIRAWLTRREQIFSNEVVGLVLDTFNDKRRAYVFLVNPFGIQIDGITTEGQGDDYSFDTLWKSEGRLTPNGFVVWIAIPFKSLRFAKTPVQTWGIALGRIIPRSGETSFWPYITRRVSYFGAQLATMTGIRDISPGRNIQLIPYGAFASARFLDQEQARYSTKQDPRVGVDAKMVVRDAFTLDVAANPDFSQVESDEPQVTVNQRFEVFFPEKRPFFIENAGMFRTPINLFFSRRIADPQLGARITGKSGKWAVAALGIDDRQPGQQVDPSDRLFDKRAAIGVLRVQRDFAKQSSVGVIATTRDFGGGFNRVAGVDTRMQMTPTWTFTGQAVASTTHGTDGAREERLSGPGYSAELLHVSRKVISVTSYTDHSPGFRSQVGFIRRTDIREGLHFTERLWHPNGKRLLNFGPGVSVKGIWDHAGRRQELVVNPQFRAEFKGNTRFIASAFDGREYFDGREFHGRGMFLLFGSSWLKWLELEGTFQPAQRINYFPGPGLSPFLARGLDWSVRATVKPTARLSVEQTYISSRLGTGDAPPAGVPRSSRIFANHIVRTKANYQFTRELTLRAILDYNAVLPDSTLVNLQRDKRVVTDFLGTYLINPWTALYVGYTNRYENLELDAASPGGIRRTGAVGPSTGRQFFIKTSYLIRF